MTVEPFGPNLLPTPNRTGKQGSSADRLQLMQKALQKRTLLRIEILEAAVRHIVTNRGNPHSPAARHRRILPTVRDLAAGRAIFAYSCTVVFVSSVLRSAP